MELKAHQDEITAWADQVFPGRTPQSALLKLFEEVGELVRNPKDPGELADLLIIALDLCSLAGVDAEKALTDKMGINWKRNWAVDQTTGVMRHVK